MKPSSPAKPPHAYPRRVLLAVVGRTPQVITETLYALAQQTPPFIPTELRVISTAPGAKDTELELLRAPRPRFHELCAHYGLTGQIDFSAEQIEVLPAELGEDGPQPIDAREGLEDIRTRAHNDAAAEFIVGRIRTLTADPECALHVSIAGGRKTMSYFAGLALSLFGRPQDRLSHVLVSPRFESNRQFFYPLPPQVEETIHGYDEQRREIALDPREAQVALAELPFLSVRGYYPEQLIEGGAGFLETIRLAQRRLEPPRVLIDYGDVGREPGLYIQEGEQIPLTPANLAFYAWVARRTQRGEPIQVPSKQGTANPDYLREYDEEAQRLGVSQKVGTQMRAEAGMTYQFWHQRKSEIQEVFEENLMQLAGNYVITQVRQGRPAGYGLAVPPERIAFQS